MQLLFALLVAAAASPEDAELFHAEGLLLEVDAKPDAALQKLRAAAEAQPQNIDYAADAVRLAWKLKADGWQGDRDRFLAMTPKTADQWLLRGYLEADRGESANAKAAVKQSLSLRPQGTEALGVQKMLDEAPAEAAAQRERSFNVHGAVGTEYDSNVLVFPDQPNNITHHGGARLTLNFGGAWLPKKGDTNFSVGANLRAGFHLSNRTEVGQYDFFVATVSAAAEHRFGAELQQRFIARLFTDQTLLGPFSQYFLGEYGAQVMYDYRLGMFSPGVYAEGSYRNYVSSLYTPPGAFDREGPRWAGGLSGALTIRDFAGILRAGVQTEHAFGFNQRELGPSVSLGARYTVWRLLLQASVGYEGRFYYKSDISGQQRNDNRIPVSVAAGISVQSWLAIEASYLFVQNLSSIKDAYQYQRHIGGLAVKGSY